MKAPTSALFFIIAMSVRLRDIFAEVRLSATLLVQATRRHIATLTTAAADIRAIDDPMEAAAPDLWECLKNDPPAKRRRVWAAWQTTHARTEAQAAALRPDIPARLLAD